MIFVLDIGTRSVVGLLGTLQQDKILIQHSAIAFHKKRAMYDGQIHDIEAVAEVVKKVKLEIEEKAGVKLEEVAIAAAGRALKTHQTTVEEDLNEHKEIDKHLIHAIEIEGIQQAQKELEKDSEEVNDYFCVGHTVVNYYLDDGFIKTPIGHKGRKLTIDVLATFLPRIVVDSLYTVMARVGLEVSYLTLEPIAAIEVAVPENMRLLNIALVDIGAGTSDMAITQEGRITSYGMTSVAGDEITEELAKLYLLDFDTAEELKCNLCRSDQQNFTDIIGIQQEIATGDILEKIKPTIDAVASKICKGILEKNQKSPSVVFLIGGGSQIPQLSNIIAQKLEMPKERVVVRTIENIQNLQGDARVFTGPEGITPIGILVKAINNETRDFIEVEVNKQRVKLFKTQGLKVSDALLMTDLKPRDLVPKKGESLKVFVNGKETTIYGEYGESAEILVNNKISNLDTPINTGDSITIKPAKQGKHAVGYLLDVVKFQDVFYVNDKEINKFYNVKINGEEIKDNKQLRNKDEVQYTSIDTVEDLYYYLRIDAKEYDVYIDGAGAYLYNEIAANVRIITEKKEDNDIKEDASSLDKEKSLEVIYNGKPIKIHSNKTDLIFVDIFNFVDFNRNEAKGKLVLKHNGEIANYTNPLRCGDEIEVYWEN
ncbi:MAG: pilus assembly protein PilM [Clostridiaceae bacterium]|nr:pilus assembly protein PilM [Clostridiaceae bacterium]